MGKNIKWLTLVLTVQIGLFVFFMNRNNPTAVFKQTENLLSLDFDKLDRIVVSSEGQEIEIAKSNGTWVLPGKLRFPVSPSKISTFFDQLKSLKRSLPVGNTSIAAKQLLVSESKFERKVEFYSNEKKLQTLFVGDSPSFRKIYARLEGEDHTFSVSLSNHDVPDKYENWYDKDFYHLNKSKITEVVFSQVTLKKNKDNFEINGLKADQQTDLGKVNPLLGKLTRISLEDVLGKDQMKTGELILEYSVTIGDNDKVNYQYFEPLVSKKEVKKDKISKENSQDKSPYVILKSSKEPFFVKVNRFQIEELTTMKRAGLIKSVDIKTAQARLNSADESPVKR